MRTFKTGLIVLLMQILFGMASAAQAQTSMASFGVTIQLRTFHDTVTAEHRCIQRLQFSGRRDTFHISCPTTVDIQAIAKASTSKTGQSPRMNGETTQPDSREFMVAAGKPMYSTDPIELTISW